MIQEVLLTSESFVRAVTNISDNVAGKFLQPAIREAQDMGLRPILGDCLTDALCAKVADSSIQNPENTWYRDLLDRCQYYLAYMTAVEILPKISYKLDNFGASRTTDENQQAASFDEIAKLRYYYQAKADGYASAIQRWTLDNRARFPELDDCACNAIRSNLYSSASCGIWLGGPRGKMTKPTKGGGCCR